MGVYLYHQIKQSKPKRRAQVMGNNIYHVEETYRGYDICHWIGQSYVYVEYCGDEIQFESVQDAELFIDTIVE